MIGDGARERDGDRDQSRSPGVANTVSAGVHGSLVQAGVVHGDITIREPASQPEVVPRQLPAAPWSLVGRAAELRELDEWATATTGRRLLVAVGGQGVWARQRWGLVGCTAWKRGSPMVICMSISVQHVRQGRCLSVKRSGVAFVLWGWHLIRCLRSWRTVRCSTGP